MQKNRFPEDRSDELKPDGYSPSFSQFGETVSAKPELIKEKLIIEKIAKAKKLDSFPSQLSGPDVLTPKHLAKAIAYKTDFRVDIEEAKKDTEFVMDYFGFDDRIIDNILNPEDRQVFYILEEEGMLTTEREETMIYDGREWRTHYWKLNRNVIFKYAEEYDKILREQLKKVSPAKLNESKENEENIYETLEDDIWKRKNVAQPKGQKVQGLSGAYNANLAEMVRGNLT